MPYSPDATATFYKALTSDVNRFSSPEEVREAKEEWIYSKYRPYSVAGLVLKKTIGGSGVGEIAPLLEYAIRNDPDTRSEGTDLTNAAWYMSVALRNQSEKLMKASRENAGVRNIPRRGLGRWLRDQVDGGHQETTAIRMLRRESWWRKEIKELNQSRNS